MAVIVASAGEALKTVGMVEADCGLIGGPDLEEDALGLTRTGLGKQSRQEAAGDSVATAFGAHGDVF